MLLKELNQHLVEIKELQRQQRKLQDHLKDTLDRLEQERSRLAELERSLGKENRDVKQLENLSIKGLFYAVLGSKEEQLQKERQEFLAAKLKHDQSRYQVDALTREAADLKDQLSRLGDVDARYQSVLAQKADLLAHSDDPQAKKLLELSEQLADAQSESREIREAIDAGQAASDGLRHVVDAMRSASGWGVWDMLGGGLIATAVKHSRMDEARDAAYHVQDLLRRFRRELADVQGLPGNLIEEVGSFETFADYFFDGLIVDWVVQSKIDRSLDNAQKAYNQVNAILAKLQRRQKEIQDRLERLKTVRQEFLEQAA
jgi:DNA repair exonuclease SbcCD ATPase subunit